MPPRKVQKLSSKNQQERAVVMKAVERKKEEHSCTKEDVINSFKEIGLEELVKDAL